MEDFVASAYETALEPGELILAVRVPPLAPGAGWPTARSRSTSGRRPPSPASCTRPAGSPTGPDRGRLGRARAGQAARRGGGARRGRPGGRAGAARARGLRAHRGRQRQRSSTSASWWACSCAARRRGPRGAAEPDPGESPAADVLVVGAGSAGCVLAARLSEDPGRRVCLVEAGGPAGRPPPGRPPPVAVPRRRALRLGIPHRPAGRDRRTGPLMAPRRACWGAPASCTPWPTCAATRPISTPWAEAGGPGWSHDALLPYFIRSESFSRGASAHHGADGPMTVWLPDRLHPVAEAYMRGGRGGRVRALGRPQRPAHGGAGAQQPDDPRRPAGLACPTPTSTRSAARPNLEVVTEALVERVVISGGRATGIEAVVAGERRTLAAGTVVLAAGAVSSPMILMRSGIGAPRGSRAPRHRLRPRAAGGRAQPPRPPPGGGQRLPGAADRRRPRSCSTPSRCSTSTTPGAPRPTSSPPACCCRR